MDLVPDIGYSVGVDLVLPPEPSEDDDFGPRHDEYIEVDVRSLADHIRADTFDCVLALDVIEHVDKEDGYALLEAMERIATKRVIVFTPNGYLYQPPEPGNPYQEHISGWNVDDFSKVGYSVTGINGWKPLRGPYARCRWSPRRFWERVSLLTEPLVETRPDSSFQLLAVKELTVPDH